MSEGDKEIASFLTQLGLMPIVATDVLGLDRLRDLGEQVRKARAHPEFPALEARRNSGEVSPQDFLQEIQALAAT